MGKENDKTLYKKKDSNVTLKDCSKGFKGRYIAVLNFLRKSVVTTLKDVKFRVLKKNGSETFKGFQRKLVLNF